VGKIETFSASDLSAPAKLTADHIIDDFDFGYPFEPSPVDPLKLMLLIKDAEKTFKAQNG
jgi:hypothetical protein